MSKLNLKGWGSAFTLAANLRTMVSAPRTLKRKTSRRKYHTQKLSSPDNMRFNTLTWLGGWTELKLKEAVRLVLPSLPISFYTGQSGESDGVVPGESSVKRPNRLNLESGQAQ